MTIATTTTAIVLAIAMSIAAAADALKLPPPMKSVSKGIVKETTLPILTTVKAAAAVGIIIGLFVPWIGVAAVIGQHIDHVVIGAVRSGIGIGIPFLDVEFPRLLDQKADFLGRNGEFWHRSLLA